MNKKHLSLNEGAMRNISFWSFDTKLSFLRKHLSVNEEEEPPTLVAGYFLPGS
jgi:hypothetical protein